MSYRLSTASYILIVPVAMNFRSAFRRAAASVRHFSQNSADFEPASVWSTYNRYLAEKPVMTKSITSGVIAFVGDVACQKLFPADKDNNKVDWKRTANFTIMGAVLIGPMLHHWYSLLGSKFPGTSTLATLYRVGFDQFLFAPFAILPAVFSFTQVFNGTPELIPQKLHEEWMPTCIANFSLWIPAQLINFKFVPPQYQVLFANVVGLFWNVYLSAATNKSVKTPVLKVDEAIIVVVEEVVPTEIAKFAKNEAPKDTAENARFSEPTADGKGEKKPSKKV